MSARFLAQYIACYVRLATLDNPPSPCRRHGGVRTRGIVVGVVVVVLAPVDFGIMETGENKSVERVGGKRRTNVDVIGVGKHTHASTRLATDP